MRGLLSVGGQMAAALSAAAALLSKRASSPQQSVSIGLFGVPQAYRYCPTCDAVQAHIIHSSVCRRCTTCGHLTHPGDPA